MLRHKLPLPPVFHKEIIGTTRRRHDTDTPRVLYWIINSQPTMVHSVAPG
ncbi:hypothetical protein HanXRQr2_Chr06g0256291 [Helianthus annuus]|uniref:Uncharacterized protein n=1 Tax=Helianthus annuus TaxID=4232 RepID=A0A9K3IS79_HELAN|nr:hypothetical protein HanXRQr2_Chr06g0256291 [Helianthus annuus]